MMGGKGAKMNAVVYCYRLFMEGRQNFGDHSAGFQMWLA
jgi:hypothetical protein